MSAAPLPPFLSYADQGMYLAQTAGGPEAVIQLLWRYDHPVDLVALTRFRDRLGQGRLGRLIRPALLPFGRHQWAAAPPPRAPLAPVPAALSPDALLAWADAQVDLPLDPSLGPAWNLTLQPFTDGSTFVSLVVSHCIADGMATAFAVRDALVGEGEPLAFPPRFARRGPAALAAEIRQAAQDLPLALRALTGLLRTARRQRGEGGKPAVPPQLPGEDLTVSYPSAFLRVPLSAWDDRAKSLGANRITLLAALTAAFGAALGRAVDGTVKLLMPVSQRSGPDDSGGNRVVLAALSVPEAEREGRLHALQRRLQTALLRAMREPDPLAAALPLVPFVPRRAAVAAGRLALGALEGQPVTLSYMGDRPEILLDIDGTPAARMSFRGTDRRMSRRAITARNGVATLLAGAGSGYIFLNFVAYQPGVMTEPHRLRELAERLLAGFGLQGEHFDA